MGKRNDLDAWSEAKRRCGLNDEEVRMAKELGFQPRSLIQNIPAPSQRWKAPVKEWVRSLYEKKFASRRPAPQPTAAPPVRAKVVQFRNPAHPWPDHPEIQELVLDDPFDDGDDSYEGRFEPPSEADIDGQENYQLRRQALYRWGAQFVAIALSQLSMVERVAAFGAVAAPLKKEIPRFRDFRRHGIKILHECGDVDLAVWVNDPSRLKELKRALNLGLSIVQITPYGGIAHHQADVHIFDAVTGKYLGRLCHFGECPKPQKRECLVPDCGSQPFLLQFAQYRFRPAQFESEDKVILFDRAEGFVVQPPRMDAKPVRFQPRQEQDDLPGKTEDEEDEDSPF
jgi:hypothetical protein